MTEKKPLLKVENISKHFGSKKVFENVNFEIFPGEIFGLVGLSGAGKTTLLDILCGYENQDAGRILFHDSENSYEVLILDEDKLRSVIGFSSQEPSFYGSLSIEENLEYFGTLYGIEEKDLKSSIDELLNLLKLSHARTTLSADLSEGMKKRLDIAISLIHSPKILILDEPTSYLDVLLREELYHFIKKINDYGVTILFVSHYIDEIKLLCKRVGILHSSSLMLVNNMENIEAKFKALMREEYENE